MFLSAEKEFLLIHVDIYIDKNLLIKQKQRAG
jgi:hypothetical protein